MIEQSDKNKNENHLRHSDFSIDHILNRAGCSSSSFSVSFNKCDNSEKKELDAYSWLQCTRYCPPKVPRSHRKDGPHKRQLGRHPRIPFTSHQLSVLEEKFQQSPYLSSEEVILLSKQLQLADIRVKIWFQNRRARERREKLQHASSNESQEGRDKGKHLLTLSDGASPSVQPVVHETNFCNFLSPHALLQNHLGNYLVPVTICPPTEIQYFSTGDSR